MLNPLQEQAPIFQPDFQMIYRSSLGQLLMGVCSLGSFPRLIDGFHHGILNCLERQGLRALFYRNSVLSFLQICPELVL